MEEIVEGKVFGVNVGEKRKAREDIHPFSRNKEDLILDEIVSELSYQNECWSLSSSDLWCDKIIPEENEFMRTSSSIVVYPPDTPSRPAVAQPLPTRKRRKYHLNNISKNKKLIRIPRILNSDIRRRYPIMFMNMMNSLSLPYIDLFLRSFSQLSTLRLTNAGIRLGLVTGNSQRANSVEFQGMNEAASFLFLHGLTMPDKVIEMRNSEIVSRSDTFQTTITIYWTVSGKKLYQCNPIRAGLLLKTSSGVDTRQQISSPDLKRPDEIALFKLFYQQIPPLTAPLPYFSHGKFTLIILDYRKSMKIDEVLIECHSPLTEKWKL